MPPKVRFQQQDIIDAAYVIAREKGQEAINARSVAGEIGCSTQPIFRVFENMDQLKAKVLERAIQRFEEYIKQCRAHEDSGFKAVGMAYLLYAMEEPHLFHMVFLHGPDEKKVNVYSYRHEVIDCLMEKSGFNREQSEQIHRHMWIYTYGLAALLATERMHFTPDELNGMLLQEYRAVVAGLLWEKAPEVMPPV